MNQPTFEKTTKRQINFASSVWIYQINKLILSNSNESCLWPTETMSVTEGVLSGAQKHNLFKIIYTGIKRFFNLHIRFDRLIPFNCFYLNTRNSEFSSHSFKSRQQRRKLFTLIETCANRMQLQKMYHQGGDISRFFLKSHSKIPNIQEYVGNTWSWNHRGRKWTSKICSGIKIWNSFQLGTGSSLRH